MHKLLLMAALSSLLSIVSAGQCVVGGLQQIYCQCGGKDWKQGTQCQGGCSCQKQNECKLSPPRPVLRRPPALLSPMSSLTERSSLTSSKGTRNVSHHPVNLSALPALALRRMLPAVAAVEGHSRIILSLRQGARIRTPEERTRTWEEQIQI